MELIAKKRTELGKKTKQLRRERMLPGVVFAKGMDSIPVTVSMSDFIRVYNQVGETNIVELKVDGKTEKVLIKDVHLHPVSDAAIHVNFHKVNLKERMKVTIPVEFINEETNPLIKSGEAIVLALLNDIEIEALPTDLPDAFIVDVEKLVDMDSVITVADLDYDREKVELVGYEPDALVAKLDYAVSTEEEEENLTEEELLSQIEATAETAKDNEEEEEEEK